MAVVPGLLVSWRTANHDVVTRVYASHKFSDPATSCSTGWVQCRSQGSIVRPLGAIAPGLVIPTRNIVSLRQRLSSSSARLRRTQQMQLANSPFLSAAIFLKSISFYLFVRLSIHVHTKGQLCESTTEVRSQFHAAQQDRLVVSAFRSTSTSLPHYPYRLFLSRAFCPSARPDTEHKLPQFPTTPPSCLPQSSSSVPSPTTRAPILRVEGVCTKWQNRIRPVGGGQVRFSRCTTSLRSLLSSSVIAQHCPMATRTGSMQKVRESPIFDQLRGSPF